MRKPIKDQDFLDINYELHSSWNFFLARELIVISSVSQDINTEGLL